MPAVLPDGLEVGAVLPREDPRDALVMPLPTEAHSAKVGGAPEARPTDVILEALGPAPRLGTSSIRRSAQLRRLMTEARFEPIRGNLDTRLRKLDSGDFDAIILASAGLRRLGHGNRISYALPIETCVPAPGQGIIAVEVRAEETDLDAALLQIDDPHAALALRAERAVVTRLGGGCQMPIGAYAAVTPERLTITAVVVSMDGMRVAHAVVEGSPVDAEALGTEAAQILMSRGADHILAEVQRAQAVVQGLQP
jgi:hydroxymethylbilane synthase